MTTTQSTNSLFRQTHNALIDGRWSQAQALLDQLSRREDNHFWLNQPHEYGVPETLRGVIGDRIELVNSKVDRA